MNLFSDKEPAIPGSPYGLDLIAGDTRVMKSIGNYFLCAFYDFRGGLPTRADDLVVPHHNRFCRGRSRVKAERETALGLPCEKGTPPRNRGECLHPCEKSSGSRAFCKRVTDHRQL